MRGGKSTLREAPAAPQTPKHASSSAVRPRVLCMGFRPPQILELRTAVPEAECLEVPAEQFWDAVPDMDALIGLQRAAFEKVFTTQLLRVGKRLRWVHVSGAGVEEYLIPGLGESRFAFTNGKVIQGPEVADHAWALLLALTRNLHLVLTGRGDGTTPRPIELRGKTALVIGLGGVGLLIAQRAAAFGMRVQGVDPRLLPLLPQLEQVFQPEQLSEALSQADVVFVAAPVTPRSAGMLDSWAFAAMKPSAYVINVSRGRIIRTDALVQALKAGRLAGAGLDVTDPEPLPAEHPLRTFPNVVMTPHLAGLSDRFHERGFELVKINLRHFVRGLPLLNRVDKEVGY